MMNLTRREVLVAAAGAACLAAVSPEDELRRRIDAARPSRLGKMPASFRDRIGTTHVAGRYHLTDRPFLLEGARKMIELGTRVGKFWFQPGRHANDYPFNSKWEECQALTDLARTAYFREVFAMPFTTIMLEAHTRSEGRWRQDQPREFYDSVSWEFEELTAHLYREHAQRDLTLILQHWEGDWMLRGAGGAKWDPPPDDWHVRCERMAKWLAARQAGVTRARAAAPAGTRCRVLHAAEVNRVADIDRGIPTVTDKVLPAVELDLISYSAYDAMADGPTLYRRIEQIRQYAKTGPVLGKGAVYVGEIGIPENEQPNRIAERWDEWVGAALAANALYVVQWELYCNEPNTKQKPAPRPPIQRVEDARGFWLVRPDGKLSETGEWFRSLWR